MAGLNLLPWREEAREESRKQFMMIAISAAAIGVLTVFSGYTWMQGNISYQEQRNARLNSEIKFLDKRIAEIKSLDATRKALLDRIEIIDTLQSTRPSIVHLFDEMVKSLPKGLYLTKLEQKGNTIKLVGKSESNARVSSYMERLDDSIWLSSSNLSILSKDKKQGDIRLRKFVLNVTQLLKPETPGVSKGEN
ncbi:MAG: PilN domain-containing protein [Thiotrichaceae bacterium]